MHKKIKLSKSNLLLKVVAYVVMGLLAAMAILPCLHIISKAFSRGADVTAGNVVFWPKGFQLETVWYVLTKTSFLNALKNSLIVTIGGTAISMFTTITTAYDYDGLQFCVEASVDAVQEHNAEDAILSAWGRKVSISNGSLSLN